MKMNLEMNIAENIRYLRRRAKLTQVKLSQMSGVSQSNLSNLERGSISTTVDALEKLARPLKVEAWQLLMPTDLIEQGITGVVTGLIRDYLAADAAGRDTILRVAQSQALLVSD